MHRHLFLLLLLTVILTIPSGACAKISLDGEMIAEPAISSSTRENIVSDTPALKQPSIERKKQAMLAHLSRIKKHLQELKKKIQTLTKLDLEIQASVVTVIDEHITWIEQQEGEVKNATIETFDDLIKNIRDVWTVRKDLVYFYAGLVKVNKIYVMHARTVMLYEKLAAEYPESEAIVNASTSLEEVKISLEELKKIWITLEDDIKPRDILSASNKQISVVSQGLRLTLSSLKEVNTTQ